jgi:hypothetical protein
MRGHLARSINPVLQELIPALPVTQRWFQEQGIARARPSEWAKKGLLENPVRGVYYRPGPTMKWQHVVLALQHIHNLPLGLGGFSALALHGHMHFLPTNEKAVHLYGTEPLPTWVEKLAVAMKLPRFIFHRELLAPGGNEASRAAIWEEVEWGEWGLGLRVASRELAILQWLDELPNRASWENVLRVFEGLTNLRPRLLQELLPTRSVKVRRLFLYLSSHQKNYSWARQVLAQPIDIGTGKRVVFKGGRLDRTYLITVPDSSGDPA